MPTDELLSVKELVVELTGPDGTLSAVDGVNLEIARGEAVAIVGESGSGKTSLARALIGLLPRPHGRIASGAIHFCGVDLRSADSETLRSLRGKKLAMIFQEPAAALNPVRRVGDQIAEAFSAHQDVSKPKLDENVRSSLGRVGLEPEVANAYPHELSGGMRQRILIAMALAHEPELLIADEPTSAVDAPMRAEILALMDRLRKESGTALLVITHDFAVVREIADRVCVMYAGQIVEDAPTAEILKTPKHPYTARLLRAIPDDAALPLAVIPGSPPSLNETFSGCRFAPRCDRAAERCTKDAVPLDPLGETHYVRCFFPEDNGS